MKLSPWQVEIEQLQALAATAGKLLVNGDHAELAARFGYAVSLNRTPLAAIREDLGASLASLQAAALDPSAEPTVQVKYFNSKNHPFALAECRLLTVGGSEVLLEFVVSAVGRDFHATLEQISAAA